MKQLSVFALAAVSLMACSTTPGHRNQYSSESSAETVLITYHVKPGKEQQLRETLSRAWDVYREEHLVFAQPHLITRDKANGDKPRFVEVFTWVSRDAPDHAPESVKKIWDQIHSLCEARDGHAGLEGGEVEMLIAQLP